MCGRYSITKEELRLRDYFGTGENVRLLPRYNIAPTQLAPVVVSDGDVRVESMHWGLIPSWSKDASSGYKMINARAETVLQKSTFRRCFESRRCIALADGFYEWQKQSGISQPFRITLRSGTLFGMAGLWDEWLRPDGTLVKSFTIITTAANESVRPVHDRMPVMLKPENFQRWINSETPCETLQTLLCPYPSAELIATPVSAVVNNARNDVPECTLPLKEAETRSGTGRHSQAELPGL